MSERQSSDYPDHAAPPQPSTDPPAPPSPRNLQPPDGAGGTNHFDAPLTEADPEAPSYRSHLERPSAHHGVPTSPLDETTVFADRSVLPDNYRGESPRHGASSELAQEWGGQTEPSGPPPGYPSAEPDRAPNAHPNTGLRRAIPPPGPSRLDRGAPQPGEPGPAASGRGSGVQPRSSGQQWSDDPGRWNQAQGSAANWNYTDRIRSSELVPTRRIPPARGWRKFVYLSSFKVINPGQSPDERHQADLEAKVRSLLRGKYKIGVLGKGGVGKTTVAAGVGSVFAELRQDDRVVALDADTAFGKLASRIDPSTSGSYWELAGDRALDSFSDIRSRVGSNTLGLFVLGGETATARRRVLDPRIYREAAARLDKHFTLSIVDCGSTMDSPVTREVLNDVDALIVVSSPWFDGASAAGQTLEWLANSGYTGLLHRTVVVINDSDGNSSKGGRATLAERFGGRGQKVIEMPFDGHLRPGGVIDVQNELEGRTRRQLVELAAACAEHFAATADRPRRER
jgi:MinD-like ATPase involved in chromosome partitioning or flagellar assembly